MRQIGSLLETTPTFFPQVAPDETLYSVCARFHRSSGFPKSTTTSNILFGFAHAGALRDIPVGLGHLKHQLSEALPNIETILSRMTVAGVYLPFFSADRKSEFLTACTEPPGKRAKYRLGLHASRILAQHPLKLCPHCVEDDQRNLGFAIWHLNHQYPGSWVCPNHQTGLMEVPYEKLPQRTWVLPHQSLGFAHSSPSLSHSETQHLYRLTKTMGWIASWPTLPVERLRHALIQRLYESGVIRSPKALSPSLLQSWFRSHFPESLIDICPEFRSMRNTNWIGELLTRRRTDHPLRWAVLLTALFSQEEIHSLDLDRCEATDSYSSRQFTLPTLDLSCKEIVKAPDHAYEELGRGVDIKTACAKIGISRGVLVRWLNQDSALAEHWANAKIHQKREQSRHALIELRRNQPRLSRAGILSRITAEYRWLERNDRDWLLENLPPLDRRASPQMSLF